MRRLSLAAALLLLPLPASAHAILMTSQPLDHGSLQAGPSQLTLRFNSRVDKDRSRLTLEGTDARMVLPLDGDPSPDTLAAKAELAPGAYIVHWQVLATDGHMTRGDVRFTVNPK